MANLVELIVWSVLISLGLVNRGVDRSRMLCRVREAGGLAGQAVYFLKICEELVVVQ